MTDKKDVLQGFLTLAKKGWPLFPVTGDKLPAIKKWEQSASADPSVITKWYTETFVGGCNFGFPPGRADILVIDTDVNKEVKNADGTVSCISGEDSLTAFCTGMGCSLPDTLTVRTPSGGIHRYYSASGLGSKNAFLPAVDIKSNGGYVVAPGSLTPKGGYSIIKDMKVALLPDWFIAAYGKKKPVKEKETVNYKSKITPDSETNLAAAEALIDSWEYAVEGERNDSLFRLARDLCRSGVSRDMAMRLYTERGIDHIGLDPDSAEVRNTIASAYSDMGDFGADSPEGRNAALMLLDDLKPVEGEKVPLYMGVDWYDLARRPRPERKWYIRDWLSADEGFTVLFSGRGGTGKSLVVLDLLHSLAKEDTWLGMDILRHAKSLYLSCEESDDELINRLQNIPGHLDVPKGVIRLLGRLGQENTLCAVAKDNSLVTKPFMKELKTICKEHFGTDGGVLVLDTLSDIFPGNENDRGQVAQFVKHHLNNLGKSLGLTIIVLAHPSKGASSGQGFSGSSAWEGSFRCRWELNYVKEDDTRGPVELLLAKSNTSKPGQRIKLRTDGGLIVVVDSTAADNSLRDNIIALIDEAYNEGNPYGRGAQSSRPIEKVRISDPVSGCPLSEGEIKEIVSSLLAESAIKTFRTNTMRGLMVNDCISHKVQEDGK